jgi:hypothetical protein
VLDIPEKYQSVRIGTVDNCEQTRQAVFTPAPEMETVQRKVSLDAEMEISHNKIPIFTSDDKGRAVSDKFQVHNGFI